MMVLLFSCCQTQDSLLRINHGYNRRLDLDDAIEKIADVVMQWAIQNQEILIKENTEKDNTD